MTTNIATELPSTSNLQDHYRDRYWNDLPGVLAYLCHRATGDAGLWWMDYIKRQYAATPRKRGLIIGCGNGWVERDLFDRGIVEHLEAFDVADHYLAQAEKARGSRPIDYFRCDFESFAPKHQYDLIVNVAALHHAKHLYAFLHRLAPALSCNGIFVNWDYTGPSRNQYPSRQVRFMREVNASLPPRFRTCHQLRPSLHTLLTGDPTEAVHSSEILKAVKMYFEFVECNELGGGIAYQILWNNLREFEANDPEAKNVLQQLLSADEEHTRNGNVPSLFSFFICKPRKAPRATALLHTLVREPLREQLAARMGGLYLSEIITYLAQKAAGLTSRF